MISPQPILTVPELIRNVNVPKLSLDLELPRQEAPIPFYVQEDVDENENTKLNAPEISIDYPVPSDELTAPRELVWNPNNNPNYYFGSIEQPQQPQQQQQQPLQQQQRYPKKYIKELHEKDKPSNYKNLDLPKIEKILYNLSKNENRANLQKERQVINNKNNEQLIKNNEKPKKIVKKLKDSSPEASFDNYEPLEQQLETFESVPLTQPSSSSSSLQFNNAQFQSSPSQKSTSGERMEFQMHGFKGPKSYKWGYDTGKG